jgi:hypothetical protein
MTQFFDALERQLVALSMEAPRMTPRARARRRLAVGTVTVLCLFACVAGASVLPRLLRNTPTEQGSLLAGLPAGSSTEAGPGMRDVSTSNWSPALGSADGAIGEHDCGRQAGVGEAGAQEGIGRDVDNATGRLQGLVCLTWAGAGSRQRGKHLLDACPRTRSGRDGGVAPSGRGGDLTPSGRGGNATPSGRGGNATPSGRGGNLAPSGRGGGVDRLVDDGQSLRHIGTRAVLSAAAAAERCSVREAAAR